MTSSPGEGWYPDPDGVHQLRYHDGNDWTAHAANNGSIFQAPRVAEQGPGEGPDPGSARQSASGPDWAAHLAHEYGRACTAVLDTGQTALTVATDAAAARKMAQQRPQHEISITNFTNLADRKDAEFAPLYRAFKAAVATASEAGSKLISQFGDVSEAEMCLLLAISDENYSEVGAAIEFLRVDFPPDARGFCDLIPHVNHAIQTTPGFGDEGFQGNIYHDNRPGGGNQI